MIMMIIDHDYHDDGDADGDDIQCEDDDSLPLDGVQTRA